MKKILLLIALIGFLSGAKAQESMFSLDWVVGVPMGELADYTADVSFRGFNIGGKVFLLDAVSVGGYAGWQVYTDTKTGDDKINESIDFYGKQFRYLNVYPIMGNAFYHLGQDGGIRPYLGGNIGITIMNQRTQFGIWEVSQTSTNFTLAPEVGVFIPVGLAGGGLKTSVRYDYAFQSTLNNMDVQAVVFTIGYTMAY